MRKPPVLESTQEIKGRWSVVGGRWTVDGGRWSVVSTDNTYITYSKAQLVFLHCISRSGLFGCWRYDGWSAREGGEQPGIDTHRTRSAAPIAHCCAHTSNPLVRRPPARSTHRAAEGKLVVRGRGSGLCTRLPWSPLGASEAHPSHAPMLAGVALSLSRGMWQCWCQRT